MQEVTGPRADSRDRSTSIGRAPKIVGALVKRKRFYQLRDDHRHNDVKRRRLPSFLCRGTSRRSVAVSRHHPGRSAGVAAGRDRGRDAEELDAAVDLRSYGAVPHLIGRQKPKGQIAV
jgi:hypothetical protein